MLRLANLPGMRKSHQKPIQFFTDNGIGLRLVNAAVRKTLDSAKQSVSSIRVQPKLTGDVVEDAISLGSEALLKHVVQQLESDPIKTLFRRDNSVVIRVCGAIDYVIDRNTRAVWVEPSPLSKNEKSSQLVPPWNNPFAGRVDGVDLLNTLCRDNWLAYLAVRPGWFGYAMARCAKDQNQLFADTRDIDAALKRVTEIVWRALKADRLLVALRRELAANLTLHIGPGLINLAMRARLYPKTASLMARHLNMVWHHQEAFQTMRRENPRLLVALTAWITHEKRNEREVLTDALPLMMNTVLDSGLPPKAWRMLTIHGVKPLLPSQSNHLPWASLIISLKALNAARWPALAPRGVLRLLHDAAGPPETFDTAYSGVPGWFWSMICNEAFHLKGNTPAYQELYDAVPRWAWLVRKYSFSPDKNQRRRGIAWLREAAAAHEKWEQLEDLSDSPAWALWIQTAHWDCASKLAVVPLLSPNAMLKEAIAMHNCADSYISRCMKGNELLLSLRDRISGRRVALASFVRRGTHWSLDEVAGPCNKPVQPSVRRFAEMAVNEVNWQYKKDLLAKETDPVIAKSFEV